MTTAIRIGERICDIAITNGERATWLIPEAVDEKRLLTNVAGYGLYSGLPGIALFLGHLGRVTGNTRFSRLALAAVSEAFELYKTDPRNPQPHGGFDGIGGFAYSLIQLADVLDRPEWVGDAIKMLHKAARQATRSSELDIISGQAGLIAAALAVHRVTNDAALIQRLRPLAHKLRRLATAPHKRTDSLFPTQADAGLAHGRAGIGFALSRWANTTGEDGFRSAAAQLIRFDLEAIDARRSASPQQKRAHEQNPFHLSWCRGWLGVTLGALQANVTPISIKENNVTWFQYVADEIISFGIEGPICLCHGALGQMEFLATAVERGVLRNHQAADDWRRLLLGRLLSGDWVADETHSLKSPGLMLGLAGTGYTLLRASNPQRIPLVLTIEPPSETRAK